MFSPATVFNYGADTITGTTLLVASSPSNPNIWIGWLGVMRTATAPAGGLAKSSVRSRVILLDAGSGKLTVPSVSPAADCISTVTFTASAPGFCSARAVNCWPDRDQGKVALVKVSRANSG